MRPTAIIFGSSLGNTRFVAEKLHQFLPEAVLISATDATTNTIDQYSNLILGASTWGVGLLQDDFESFSDLLMEHSLKGKTVALFGLGDQQNYPDSFCDGMGYLYEKIKDMQMKLIGEWPASDYDFVSSIALIGDKLVGLALDEDNEPDLTDYRLKNWVKLISPHL